MRPAVDRTDFEQFSSAEEEREGKMEGAQRYQEQQISKAVAKMKGSPSQVGTVLGEAARGAQKQAEDTILNQVKFRGAYTEVPFLKRKMQGEGGRKKALKQK